VLFSLIIIFVSVFFWRVEKGGIIGQTGARVDGSGLVERASIGSELVGQAGLDELAGLESFELFYFEWVVHRGFPVFFLFFLFFILVYIRKVVSTMY
jgi:hypothetical protein